MCGLAFLFVPIESVCSIVYICYGEVLNKAVSAVGVLISIRNGGVRVEIASAYEILLMSN